MVSMDVNCRQNTVFLAIWRHRDIDYSSIRERRNKIYIIIWHEETNNFFSTGIDRIVRLCHYSFVDAWRTYFTGWNGDCLCYKGDIYKVPAQGGTAVQLTTQASYEANPVWSPDGKQIAFASDRNGNFDLFIMPADGGTASKADLSFRFGDSFGFYSGRKVCTFLRIYSRPCWQCFVSYRSNDGIV